MARAAAQGVQQVVTRTQGWAGGLNMRDSIAQLGGDEARIMENGQLDEKGGFNKRLGCDPHGTFGVGTDRILSIYTYYRAGIAPQVVIHTSGGKVYYTNDPTAAAITWTQIATGLSTTAPMSFETFNKKLYMSNGVDAYASWDGTTYTTFGSAPKGRFLRLWKDTMWVSGITGNEDRVYSSNAGDAETFGIAAWVDVAKGDGDSVTALGSDGVFLIVFKRNRIFIIYDPGLFSNRVVDYEKGCESHFSVVQFESSIFFLTRRGICEYLGDSPSRIISGKIDPLFDPNVINLAVLANTFAYTFGNQVGWALSEAGSTTPTLQIEYYPRLAAYSAFGNQGIGPFVLHRIPVGTFSRWRYQGNEYLFGGSTNANKLYRVFAPVGTDDGATFTAILETGSIDFGDPSHSKYIRRVRMLGRGQLSIAFKRNFKSSIIAAFPVDLSGSVDTWTVADDWDIGDSWGADAQFQEARIHPDIYGRYFVLRFSDSSPQMTRKYLDVGSKQYQLMTGEWGVFLVVMEAMLLGVRD